MEITNQIIGKALAEARKGKGIRQVDLANAMQVEDHTVSSWERGKNGMSAVALLQANYLLDGELLHLLLRK